ncbi:hypothetical protein SAMN05421678_11842 [Actinopolymorpha cephalotaxi]|uniref:Uncharacterized protein n=1 Tax=Actinopolymorpha cephalotaxi TaxID=504797 RepID=A0A1I3A4N5_9ACTN|nr:hypothetical protein [Actinopolymorpha cephalotaxi]NYH85345.1 hypothetical protein [Actinopolymorpha cephalotaxi]SFH45034.1 hypothetical protein SAMN05421678_11842 [Actinopolymorpha cephalotaxi]
MADKATRDVVRSLDLNAEQQSALGEVISASVAVNVYRQLGTQAADSSGCNIIGNCSSCSKLVADAING